MPPVGGGDPRAKPPASTNPQTNPTTNPNINPNPNQPLNHTNHTTGTPKVLDPTTGSREV